MTPPSKPAGKPVIVAGVLPDQPMWVLQVAGEFARTFGADLVCASVDATRYAMQALADGTMMAMPIDPDVLPEEPAFPEEWLAEVGGLLEPLGVEWSARQLVGEPSAELMALADQLDALMIVVGTRHTGFRGALHNFFTGSVALRLAHRQYRPVVVVPTAPVGPEERLPWEAR